MISLLIVFSAFAGPVEVNTAKNVAKNFYYELLPDSKNLTYSEVKPELVYTCTEGTIPIYYVFNINNNDGFVIISADDDVYPALGCSFTGEYFEGTEQPPNYIEWMNNYKEQILFVKNNGLQADEKIEQAWIEYNSNKPSVKGVLAVDPLLTTTWNQGCYYNELCPVDPAGPCGHVYAGCVATAMGQVMKYHNHPEQGTGSHSYYCPPYGTLSANFGATTYDWASMPNSIGSSNIPIATLLYHCGVSVDMDYGPDGSGAWTSDTRIALINYFSYSSSAQYKQKSNYSAVAWANLLKDELDASRPMIYRGQGDGGHAFVCDGYQGTNHFHFNWGWSGYYNGYFYLTNLNPGGSNFTDYQAAVIGIQPEVPAPVADFTANTTTVEVGGSVHFTDLSTGTITSRSWSFPGGSPSSSTQENPVIVYNNPGTYSVSLTVIGPGGSNTEVKTDYITVTNVNPEVHFNFEGGDPSSPVWTIYINNCDLYGEDLQAGDEIAIFDGETMVGAFVFTQVCTPENQFENDLIAFTELVNGNGYQAGNSFTLKVWDASENVESISFEYIFSDPYGGAYTGDVFPTGDGQYSIASLDFSLMPDPHFVFEGGDPSSPIWTIYLGGGTFEGVDLVPGDEIAIFDGDIMVGAFLLDQVLTMENMFENDLIAFSVLTTQPGYQAGNAYSFKCWDASQELEVEYFDVELFDPYGGAYMGDVFPTGDAQYSIAAIDFNQVPDPHFVFGGGNPADPVWTIYLSSATFDNLDLQPYDELAIFDGEVMVGTIRLTQVCTPANQFENSFIAWSTLSSGDPGYTPGNDIILKCWDASEEVEGVYFDIEFSNPYGDAWVEPTFPPGDGQYSISDVSYFSGGVISGEVTLNGGPGVVTDVVVNANGISVNPNPDGYYEITNLEAGPYDVSATLDAYYPESETVDVVIGEITIVDFTLNPEVGTISGTVIDELTLEPIEGVVISVEDGIYETWTSADGTYSIPDVLIGIYEVSAEIINYYPETIFDVEVVVDQTTTIDFALMPEPGVIEGTVTLNGGQGNVIDVEINLNGTVLSPNSAGYYEFIGLNPGTYEVFFTLDAYYPEIISGVIVLSNEVTTVDVTLNPEVGNIAGFITDYITGEPLEGVEVSLEGFYVVTTDVSGYYLFENLLIGIYDLSVEIEGYYPETATDIVVITDETTEVDFTLHPIHFPFQGGNPADPVWTIYLAGGTLDGLDLQIMDEIAIFDGETLVGAFTLTEVLTPGNQFNNVLIAWSTLSNGDTGYTPGNPVDLKCWDASEGIETVNVDITFHNPYGDAYVGEVFPTGDGQYSIVEFDFVTTIIQSYALSYGYQFVSTRVEPEDPNMQTVCTDLLDNLDFVRNTAGYMLRKIGPVWVNSIGDWVTTEGYLFRMNDADNFEIEGMEIDPQTPIDLAFGYQFISFLPEEPMNAQYAFTDILDNLDFVRNTAGYMLRKIGPVWVNGIGDLNPTEAYLVRMNAPDVQIYPVADKKFTGISKVKTEYFNFEGGNAADPMFTLYIEGLEIGDEVAVYNENIMVGAVKINSQNVFENELPLFSTLNTGQGYLPGKSMTFKVWSQSAQALIPVEFVIDDSYSDAYTEDFYPSEDGLFSVIRITKSSIENSEALSVFPNPANEIINILSTNEIKSIVMFNSFGQKVFEEDVNNTNAKINTGNFETGVYVIRIETLNGIETRKVSIQ